MKFHSLFLTALTALSLTLGSCSNDDAVKSPDGDADGPKITFTIGVASCDGDNDLSRADGEYYDKGLKGEKTIKNATIIIYDRPLNAPKGTGKIVKTIYVDEEKNELSKKYTESNKKEDATYFDPVASYYPQSDVVNKIKVGEVQLSNYYNMTIEVNEKDVALEYGKTYYATAICNFGDMKATFQGKDLDVLRNYIYEGKLYKAEYPADGAKRTNLGTSMGSEGIRAYSEFRMAGINETSFFWERNPNGGSVNLGDFMVQRLAARVDVMFGEPGVTAEFLNQAPGNTSYYYFDNNESHSNPIQIAVYTENGGNLTIDETKIFYLEDLQITNNVYPEGNHQTNNQSTCMYLIERSSVNPPSQGVTPVYFDNEGWEGKGGNPHYSATKYVYSPSTRKFCTNYESFHTVARYDNLNYLIKAGVFYNDTDADKNYYKNHRNSSLVGYIGENTNSADNYVKIRVVGRTDANTSSIFTPGSQSNVKSRYTDIGECKRVAGEITLYHSQNTSVSRMRNAVVRNTIYRVRIKIVARDNKIFFEYYYVSPDGSAQKVYNAEGAFLSDVGEESGSSYEPID